jgi:hypothetical protein
MPIFKNGPRGLISIADDPAWVDDELIAALVEHDLRARSLRGAMFDYAIINDSSWPLVQRLFDAHLRGEVLRTKQLYVDSALPQTTVLRYLDHLEKCDVVRRDDDPHDSRVTLVLLTESAAQWLREYYSQVLAEEQELARKNEGVFAVGNRMASNDDFEH